MWRITMKAAPVFVWLASGLLFGWTIPCVLCDETTNEQPAQVPPKPPELKVLENFVGTWDSETVAKPAEWTPKGVKTTGTNKYEWVLDGRFMQNTEQNGDASVVGWWTYNALAKAYRGWFFMSDGSTVEWKGRWDDEKGGLRMEADMGNGIVLTGVNRFPDKDTYEWIFLAKDQAGKVYLDVKETHRRRASSEKPKGGKKAESTPPKPPELKILDRYLGTWNTETLKKVAEWNPKEVRTTGTVTNERVLDGRFVQQQGKESNGAEHIQMKTYDPQRKQFRLWHFDSQASVVNSNGSWNQDAKVMIWKADSAKDITGTNTVRFVGSDTIEWRVMVRNDAGKVFVDMEGKFIRRK
jgi:hypothetical protein